MTNAHVVAGEGATTVDDPRGNTLPATVIVFDPVRDLAVLSVPGLQASPLPMADGFKGDSGAVYGYPGGGRLTASPAKVGEEILAVGTDIYRTGTSRRHVYVLAAMLAPGDSGGPFVDTRGDVIGVAFAIDPGRTATGYALTDAEVRPGASRRRRAATTQSTPGDASSNEAASRLLGFDEDALAGALLGGFDHGVEHAVGDVGQTLGATGVGEHLVAFFHVGEAVVEQREDGGRDLLAQAVAGAEILVDPDLHAVSSPFRAGSREELRRRAYP